MFVTGVSFEASRDSGFDEPSWPDVEALFHRLGQEGTGMLALEGPNDEVRLILSVAQGGRMSVNWYSERTGESWVVEWVEPAVALSAARTFFEDGARDPRLSWTPDEPIAF